MEKLHISFDTPLVVVHRYCADEEARATFTYSTGGVTVTGELMSGTMQVGTYATVSVQWSDKGGNPAKVDGPTKWETSDATICQVTPSTGNPLIANLFAPGPIGKVQIHATADADLGEGVKTVTASLDVEVIGGEAVAGNINFSQNVGQGGQSKPGGGSPSPSRR
jgi:hypothetical protein